jgi:hypothetical protein
MKPGWKTTEFWLTALAMIVALLYASGLVADGSSLEQALAFVSAVLVSLGYTAGRSLAKAKAITAGGGDSH